MTTDIDAMRAAHAGYRDALEPDGGDYIVEGDIFKARAYTELPAILDELEAGRAEIVRLREARTWRPADTAPRDGKDFLALLSNDWCVILCDVSRADKYGWWQSAAKISVPIEVTHDDISDCIRLVGWMPLPQVDIPAPPNHPHSSTPESSTHTQTQGGTL